MRIMAIDYGEHRVGIAMTDPMCTISQPLLTIKSKSDNELIKRLKYLIKENDVALILIGSPISLRGEPTEMSQKILKFVEKLKKSIDVEIKLWDERYLSKYAINMLKDIGLKEKKDKIDQVAASIMLTEFLESQTG